MSEVDFKSIKELYNHPTLGNIATAIIDDLAASQGQPDALTFSHAISVATRRAGGVQPARRDVVDFFRKLEFYGAGKLISGNSVQSEFKWGSVPAIRLARLVIGEIE